MEYPEFEALVAQANDYLAACDAKMTRFYGIGAYARYEYDLLRGEIWWSSTEGPQVRAKVTVVGSTSVKSKTWLWSWANPHFAQVDLGAIEKVREFGERAGIPKLIEASWPAEEGEAWEMTSIAARLLEAQGAYRSPGERGSLFLLFDQVEFIPEEERETYQR